MTTPNRAPWRAIVADDHAITRFGMRLLLESAGVDVVGEAENGTEALALCRSSTVNLALLDVQMPQVDGITATRILTSAMPGLAVIIITVDQSEDTILEALRAGASGFLPKDASLDEITGALEAIRSGVYVPAGIMGRLMNAHRVKSMAPPGGEPTARERAVLDLLGQGHTARRIANALEISERTVNAHVRNLYRRLGVNNRVEAVRAAERAGLLPVA